MTELKRGFGWKVVKNGAGARLGGEQRPLVPDGIDTLLLGEGTSKLGRTLWSYLSAVGHVTLYAQLEAVTAPPGEPDVAGRSFATVGTTTNSALTQAVVNGQVLVPSFGQVKVPTPWVLRRS